MSELGERRCTGCGHIEGLPMSPTAIACCPDSEYRSHDEVVRERDAARLDHHNACDVGERLERAWKKAMQERDAAFAERDKWKANHDNQVAIRRAIMDRPDLGDRSASIIKLIEQRDAYRAKYDKMVRDSCSTCFACDDCGDARTGRGCKTCDRIKAEKERDAAEKRCEALAKEVQALRLYGNKDCTAMADQALTTKDTP